MSATLPNLLTLARIAAIPPLMALVALRAPLADCAACAFFIAAALTDWLDGRIARAQGSVSAFGRMMDPIADKLLVGATLMLLAGFDRLSPWAILPAMAILLRELLVSGLRECLAADRVHLPVTRLAKWKTGVQMGALATLLAGDDGAAALGLGALPVAAIGEAMLWVAAALTLITGKEYLRTALRHAARTAPADTGSNVSALERDPSAAHVPHGVAGAEHARQGR
jgi:cardiolipin synthase